MATYHSLCPIERWVCEVLEGGQAVGRKSLLWVLDLVLGPKVGAALLLTPLQGSVCVCV